MRNNRQKTLYSKIDTEKMVYLLARRNHNFLKVFEDEISVKDMERKKMLVSQEKFIKIYLYNLAKIISLKKPYNHEPLYQMSRYGGEDWKKAILEIEKIPNMKKNRLFKQFKFFKFSFQSKYLPK